MNTTNTATNPTFPAKVFEGFSHQEACKFSADMIENVEDRARSTCIFSDQNHPHILSIPMQLACGHRACRPCLVEKSFSNEQFCCPSNAVNPDSTCAQTILPNTVFLDRFSQNELAKIVVRCEHFKISEGQEGQGSQASCNWVGFLDAYKNIHVRQCSVGRADYLANENRYLTVQLEHFKALSASSGASIGASRADSNQSERIKQLEETVALKDREIDKLKKDNQDLTATNDALITNYSSQLEAYRLQFEELSAESGLPPMEGMQSPAAAIARPGGSGAAAGQAAQVVSQSANPATRRSTPARGNRVKWTFDYTPALIDANKRVISERFTIGVYDYRLLFVFHEWSNTSVYLQVLGGHTESAWPCKESIAITLKAQGDDQGHDADPRDDIVKTIHLANTPIACRSHPINTHNIAVGFENFCQSRLLAFPNGSMRHRPNYLDDQNKITLSISATTEPSPKLVRPLYDCDLPSGSVGLRWPVREYSRIVSASGFMGKEILSPQFYTSDGGYCLKLKLNTQDAPGFEGTYAGIQAVLQIGTNDDSIRWPLKGELSVTLVDRNLFSRVKQDMTETLPIEFDRPTITNFHRGPGSKTSSEVPLYPCGAVLNEGNPGTQDPVYRYDDEILITANFVPYE